MATKNKGYSIHQKWLALKINVLKSPLRTSGTFLKDILKNIAFFAILLSSINVAFANSNNTGLSMTPTAVKTEQETSELFYVTIISQYNPQQSVAGVKACPGNSTFVNGSIVQMTSAPGLPSSLSSYTGAMYMWQCLLNTSWWGSAGGTPTLDTNQIDSSLVNFTKSLASTTTVDWESYSNIPAAQDSNGAMYTAYQYPNNAYVPFGVGGSGLGCGAAGGSSSVTCQTGGTTLSTTATSSGEWIYYVAPGQTMTCTLHRDYGSKTACQGAGCPCDGQYTAGAGQVLIGACCNGSWNVSTSNFSDPNFNTCGGGC